MTLRQIEVKEKFLADEAMDAAWEEFQAEVPNPDLRAAFFYGFACGGQYEGERRDHCQALT